MKVEIGDQVLAFIKGLAPEPRRALRIALRHLAAGSGDMKALQGELEGFFRLPVLTYRIIFRHVDRNDEIYTQCVFAERRAEVYGRFQRALEHGNV